MTDNTLNTRIISKHADGKDWVESDLLLKEGELVLAKAELDGKSVYFIKAGLEQKSFVDSAWVYAKAADVKNWAKQAALPVNCADDITADGYVEGNVVSSITFTNNEIQYTTAQVPTKNQVEIIEEILQISIPENSTEPVSVIITNLDSRINIIEAALDNYISIKDRAIFENVPFSNKAISSDIFTLLNSSIVAIQEGHNYRFEIINKENPDNLVIKSFEAVAKQNEQITGLIIDFVDTDEGYLYITDYTTANGRVNYLFHNGIYKLDISESTALSEEHIYLSLMPDNIKQSDNITQYNYIKNNYIFNMYECGQLVLDIEAGAQVNKIDSVSSNFTISIDKQLELAQSVKDSLSKADSAVQNVIVYPTWSTGNGTTNFGHIGFDICTEKANSGENQELAFDIRAAESGYINIDTNLSTNQSLIAEVSLDTTAKEAIEQAQTAIQTITSNCTTGQETSGLKVTRTENSVNIEIDDAVTFILNCGNSRF